MTASIDSEPAGARPLAPVASAFVVVAGLLVGAGALAVSSVVGSDLLRLVIALVLVLGGVWVVRPARDAAHSFTRAVGAPVLRGIGTSFVLLGAYLGGLALLTASIPQGAVLDGESAGPSPTVVILLVYGIPALALLALATTGMHAWAAAAGALLPMIAVLVMAQSGAGTAVVSVTMLVVGAALAVVVIRVPADATWGYLASAAAAMATSFAFGAGSSPFGTLGETQLAGAPESGPAGQLSAGALIVVLAGALLIAALLLLLAVARRDLAGGILAGSIFTLPPVLLSTWLPPGSRWPVEAIVALAGVPALIALAAVLAIRVPRVREAVIAILPWRRTPSGENGERPEDRKPDADRAVSLAEGPTESAADPISEAGPHSDPDAEQHADPAAGPHVDEDPASAADADHDNQDADRHPDPTATDANWPRHPSSAIATAACAVIVAAAAVAFVVLAVPVLTWAPWIQGAVALVVLVGAGALAYWLPATPGTAASIVALLGLGLASPWARLFTGSFGGPAGSERIVAGALDLLGAVVLAWFLARRHPRVGVFAAAAYTLAGSGAALLGSILFNADYFTTGAPPFGSELAPVTIVTLPLLLLGLAACVALVRGHLAVGQAVGAVVFAAAGFVPLKVLVGQFAGGGAEGYALQFALNPLTPTDWLQTSGAFRDVTGLALAAVLIMLVLGLAAATSLAARPSAPLAAAVALLVLAATQTSMITVLSSSAEDAEMLGQVLGGLAAVVAGIGIATALTASRRT